MNILNMYFKFLHNKEKTVPLVVPMHIRLCIFAYMAPLPHCYKKENKQMFKIFYLEKCLIK